MSKILFSLSTLFASILLLPLIKIGFDIQYGWFLNSLDQLAQLVIGGISDLVIDIVQRLVGIFGIRLNLFPHWEYIWTLLMLYFGRDIANAFQRGNHSSGIVHLFIALNVTTAASIMSGLRPLATGEFWNEFAIVLYPILALFGYSISGILVSQLFNWQVPDNLKDLLFWTAVWKRIRASIIRNIAFMLVAAGFLVNQNFLHGQAPSILILFIVIVLLAGYWFIAPRELVASREPGTSWWKTYKETSHFGTASAMVSVIATDGVLVLIDALIK